MTSPVRYASTAEHVQPDEADTIAKLEGQFRTILETTSKDYGHAVRAVHAKAHGIARGTLTVKEETSCCFGAHGESAIPSCSGTLARPAACP